MTTHLESRCAACGGRGTVPIGLGQVEACSECGGFGTKWAVRSKDFHAHGIGEITPEMMKAVEEVAVAAGLLMEDGPIDPPWRKLAEDTPGYRIGIRWVITAPDGTQGSIRGDSHTVTEHDDGTITVDPSLVMPSGWHGWLRRGVFTSV